MDYQPRLLKSGYMTLLASFAMVALLALPGRVGATNYTMTIAPLTATTSGSWFGSFSGAISANTSFLDHFFFTVPNSFTFTLLDPFSGAAGNSFFGITGLNASLYTNPAGSALYSGANLVNPVASASLGTGNYDLQISGTAGAFGGAYWGGATLVTNNSAIFVPPTAPIPEPETYAMMLAGLGLMGFVARRRKQKELA